MSQLVRIDNILSALSNQGVFKMFEKVSNGGAMGIKIRKAHDETTRQYYTRLIKLRNTHLIKKVGRGQFYRPTILGRIIYELVQNSKTACSLSWNLKALDQLEEFNNIPLEEKANVIRSLIPDPVLQRILFTEVRS